jgi:hypothetical protein
VKHYEESYIQKVVVSYVRSKYPNVIMTCCPAVAKSARQGRENKMMGYLAGIPDLIFAEARYGYYGLFIELKTEKGKVSDEQKAILGQLNDRGYKAIVCRSTEEAIAAIDRYLK